MKQKRSKSKIRRDINPMVMVWAELGTLDRHIASSASKRGHKHFHNKAALPSGFRQVNLKTNNEFALLPSEWRRITKKNNRISKAMHLANIIELRLARNATA